MHVSLILTVEKDEDELAYVEWVGDTRDATSITSLFNRLDSTMANRGISAAVYRMSEDGVN